jgi:hypothetical protein
LTTIPCRQCGNKFAPAFRAGRDSARRTSRKARTLTDARFCSNRCRQANYRWRSAVTGNEEKAHPAPRVLSAVTVALQHIDNTGEFYTKNEDARPGWGIVPDAKWPGMYRMRRPDGSLSDMVNLARVKDALREAKEIAK